MVLPTRTERFGYRHGDINFKKIPHPGYDLNSGPTPDADVGQPVVAPEDGVVVFARQTGGTWGGLVVIRGKDYAHRLGHVDKIRVKVGDAVKEGQQVAVIGKFPGMASHLHYDIVRPEFIQKLTKDLKAPYTRWDFWHVNIPHVFKDMYVDPAQVQPELKKILNKR